MQPHFNIHLSHPPSGTAFIAPGTYKCSDLGGTANAQRVGNSQMCVTHDTGNANEPMIRSAFVKVETGDGVSNGGTDSWYEIKFEVSRRPPYASPPPPYPPLPPLPAQCTADDLTCIFDGENLRKLAHHEHQAEVLVGGKYKGFMFTKGYRGTNGGEGGGMYISHTTVEVTGCAFVNNNNALDGGAVYIDSGFFRNYGTYYSGNSGESNTPSDTSDDSNDLYNLNGYILYTNDCLAGQTGIIGDDLGVVGAVAEGDKVSYGDAIGDGCTDCAAGKYNAIPYAFDCVNCAAGTYRSALGGTAQGDCTDCGTGK